MPTSPRPLVCLAALLLAGCSEYPGLGLSARMRVAGAEYRTEPLPAAATGPEVLALALTTSTAVPGEQDKPFSGALAPESTAVVIGLSGDEGHWLLPAGAPRVEEPDLPAFDVRLSFSPDILPGEYILFVRAAGPGGGFGPEASVPLSVEAPPPPDGALVVSLFWDTEADLDLHVVDPNGVEIWKRNINSWEPPPPGEPVDPNAWKTGAVLDFDSNAQCVIDSRRRENVIWKESAPPGKYSVRVDAFSLCGQLAARWAVEVYRSGERTSAAQGLSTEVDAQGLHDRGAGVLALEFEVP